MFHIYGSPKQFVTLWKTLVSIYDAYYGKFTHHVKDKPLAESCKRLPEVCPVPGSCECGVTGDADGPPPVVSSCRRENGH
jgi:hypothetical protein